MVPDVLVRSQGPFMIPRFTVSFVAAICRTYLFSLGSLLFGSLISSLMHTTRGDYYSSVAFYQHTLPPQSLDVPLFCRLYETPRPPSMFTKILSCYDPYRTMYRRILSMYLWYRMGIIC